MDQLPAPIEGPRPRGALSPRMTAFVVADGVLVLAFVVVLALYLSGGLGGAAARSTPSGATSGTPGAVSAGPTPDATNPAATIFALPSGNIVCELSAQGAKCTIANSTATPPVDATCSGVVGLVLTVDEKGAATPCLEGAAPGAAAAGTAVLEYGESKTVGDYTCTSSSTGVQCQNDKTTEGFKLARAGSELF
ncbi:MAG: hypothetical protein ACOH2F_18200 [Cellulomonas sp.]